MRETPRVKCACVCTLGMSSLHLLHDDLSLTYREQKEDKIEDKIHEKRRALEDSKASQELLVCSLELKKKFRCDSAESV